MLFKKHILAKNTNSVEMALAHQVSLSNETVVMYVALPRFLASVLTMYCDKGFGFRRKMQQL